MEASGGVVTPGTGVREGEKEREEARVVARRGPRRSWVRPLFMWIAVIFICIFCLFPFYCLITVSLKAGSDLSSSDIFPPHPTLDNYSSIFKNDNFTSALKNSVIITTVTTILALIVGSFAAYALRACASSASSCSWRSSCRSRRSRRSRSRPRSSSSGPISGSTTRASA